MSLNNVSREQLL